MTPKIATCCYCGTRAALTLRGKERHELTCSNCGAPLSEMKMMRSDGERSHGVIRPAPGPRAKHRAAGYGKKPRKRKATKSLSRRFMEEIMDVAEDLFDILD